MIRYGAHAPLILNLNECKNELEGQRIPSNHKQRIAEEIDDRNDGKNEKANDKDSEEDYGDITTECDFVVSYAGTDEEQLIMLSEKDYKDLCDGTDDEGGFYGF